MSQPFPRVLSQALRPLPEPLAHDYVQRRYPGGAGERVPSEGRMVTAAEPAPDILGGHGRADRDPARERFRQYQEVGDHAPALEGEQPAGPPHTGLHFVQPEEGSDRGRAGARRREELGGGHVDPALPLDRFEEHQGGPLIDSGRERGYVVERDVDEPWNERFERLAKLLAPRRAERPERAAVEPPHRRNDLRPSGRRAGELDRRLDGFGP